MGDFSVYVNNFNTNSNFSKFVLIYMLLFFIVILVNLVGMIKIYKKLNKPGWAVIVPIYNIWALFEGVGLPGWLSILPVANLIGLIVAYFRLARVLNKSAGFGLGLVFLSFIFIPILGFSDAKMSTNDDNNSVEGFDLMASDPNAGGDLNLMTRDPVASVPTDSQVAQPETPTIDTTPSFEEQISESAPSVSPAFVPSEPVQEPVQPVQEENIITDNISLEDNFPEFAMEEENTTQSTGYDENNFNIEENISEQNNFSNSFSDITPNMNFEETVTPMYTEKEIFTQTQTPVINQQKNYSVPANVAVLKQ